ncbi:MAG: hypothetical protein DMG49_06735, partial [Acidobacteria bacterium]
MLFSPGENKHHWITLKLLGGPRSPRDASGVKTFLMTSFARQRADVTSGESYGSSHDQRVHLGLGSQSGYEARASYCTGIDGLDWTIGDVLNPPPSLEEAAGRDVRGDEA